MNLTFPIAFFTSNPATPITTTQLTSPRTISAHGPLPQPPNFCPLVQGARNVGSHSWRCLPLGDRVCRWFTFAWNVHRVRAAWATWLRVTYNRSLHRHVFPLLLLWCVLFVWPVGLHVIVSYSVSQRSSMLIQMVASFKSLLRSQVHVTTWRTVSSVLSQMALWSSITFGFPKKRMCGSAKTSRAPCQHALPVAPVGWAPSASRPESCASEIWSEFASASRTAYGWCRKSVCLCSVGMSRKAFFTTPEDTYHVAENEFERFRRFLELIADSNSIFVVAKIIIFERFEFWCVQSSITNSQCGCPCACAEAFFAPTIPIRILWCLRRFTITYTYLYL